jgi:hypothetical protein
MKSFWSLILLLAAPVLHCGSEPSDLGQGLSYLRTVTLSIDLPTWPTPKAVVLDLRYTTGDETAAAALTAWLQARAGAPTFVLANPETAAPLRQALSAVRLPAGTLTVGRADDEFTPDIIVAVTTDDDQTAWNALTAGTEPATLIADNLGKVRNDEAAIVRRHQNGASGETETVDDSPAPISVLPDRVLQRAVQLHRGLRVFGVFPRGAGL